MSKRPRDVRRFPDDRPANPGPADHPRLGRLRDPGPRGVAEPAVRLRGGAAAAVVSGRRRGGRRAVAGDLGRRAGRRRDDDGDDDGARAGLQLRADRSLPGRDRGAPDGDAASGSRASSSTWRRRGSSSVTGVFPDPYALKRVSPERSPRRSWRPSRRRRPGQHADRIAWMAARLRELESQLSLDPLRLLAPRLALDPRRLPAPARAAASPSRSSRRSRPSAVDPAHADLRAGRTALHHRPLRARPPRADARRQPLGRRRQGDGAGRPRAAAGEASQDRRSGSRRSCSRSSSATSATCR